MAEQLVVVFHIGKEEYCVPIQQVREIIQYKGATKMPGTPKHFVGIINLRDKIIPVIDLAVKFEIDTHRIQRQALIIQLGEQNIGWVVDTVSEVLRLQDSSIEAVPEQTVGEKNYISRIGKADNRLLILLDPDKLVEHYAWQANKVAS